MKSILNRKLKAAEKKIKSLEQKIHSLENPIEITMELGDLATEGKGIKFLGNLYATSWQPSALWVNCDGNRFSNEDVAFSFAQAANAIYAQPHHYGWSIFDDSQVKYMMEKGVDSGIGVLVPVGQKLPNLQKDSAVFYFSINSSFRNTSLLSGRNERSWKSWKSPSYL